MNLRLTFYTEQRGVVYDGNSGAVFNLSDWSATTPLQVRVTPIDSDGSGARLLFTQCTITQNPSVCGAEVVLDQYDKSYALFNIVANGETVTEPTQTSFVFHYVIEDETGHYSFSGDVPYSYTLKSDSVGDIAKFNMGHTGYIFDNVTSTMRKPFNPINLTNIQIYPNYGGKDYFVGLDNVNNSLWITRGANSGYERDFKVYLEGTNTTLTSQTITETIDITQYGGFDEGCGIYLRNTAIINIPNTGTQNVGTISGYNEWTLFSDVAYTDTYKALDVFGIVFSSITVSVDNDWLTATYIPSMGGVYLSASANTSNLMRFAQVTISGTGTDGETYTTSFAVQQLIDVSRYDEYYKFDNQEVYTDFEGKTLTQSYYFQGQSGTVQVQEQYDWITASVTQPYDGVGELTIQVTENQSNDDRIGFVIVYDASNSIKPNYVMVKQSKTIQFQDIPIWQDTYLTYKPHNNEVNYISYAVYKDGDSIYNGRVYKINNTIEFNVNPVIENYLNNSIEFTSNDVQYHDNQSYIKFDIYISEDDWASMELWDRVFAYDNWSYDDTETNYLSHPITNKIARNQYFLYTVLDKYTPRVSGDTGTSVKVILDEYSQAGQYTLNAVDGIKTLVLRLNNLPYSTTDKITVKDADDALLNKFEVVDMCKNNYVLYYLNKYGGWDSMIFEGKELMKDAYTLNTYQKNYNSSNTQDRGKVIYQKDVQRKWELTTGYLTDRQSKMMDNVFGTTQAYLHDLNADKVIAVNVTSNTLDFKTYRNNGRKFFTYTINLESADWNRKRR